MAKDKKIKIGAVVSEFHYDITMMMLERAREHAQFLGSEIMQVVIISRTSKSGPPGTYRTSSPTWVTDYES